MQTKATYIIPAYQLYRVRRSYLSKEIQGAINVQKSVRKTWPRLRNPSLEQRTSHSWQICGKHATPRRSGMWLNLGAVLSTAATPCKISLMLPPHCGKIIWPIWVVLPPSTQLSWYHQPDKVGGSLNSVPAYLDGVLPARSTETVHQLTWMGGYQPNQLGGCSPCVPAYLYGGYHTF